MTILYFIFRKRNRLGHQSWVILLLRFPYKIAKSRAEQGQPPYWSAIFQMTFLPFFALTTNCTLSPTQQKLIQSVIVLILSLFFPPFLKLMFFELMSKTLETTFVTWLQWVRMTFGLFALICFGPFSILCSDLNSVPDHGGNSCFSPLFFHKLFHIL